jgi:hypothetical protein
MIRIPIPHLPLPSSNNLTPIIRQRAPVIVSFMRHTPLCQLWLLASLFGQFDHALWLGEEGFVGVVVAVGELGYVDVVCRDGDRVAICGWGGRVRRHDLGFESDVWLLEKGERTYWTTDTTDSVYRHSLTKALYLDIRLLFFALRQKLVEPTLQVLKFRVLRPGRLD